MPADLITLAHFSVSSAMSLPKSAGKPGSAVPPRLASCALNLGLARPVLISLLSLSIICGGVFLGAPTPYHWPASKPGRNSPIVGMPGSVSERVALATSARSVPVLMYSGPGCGFLDRAPELKSLGIDCFLDRRAREVVGRSFVRPDRAGGGPGTMVLRQLAAREVGRERPQILPRFRLENVNPHGLIPSGVDDGRRVRRGAPLEVGAHQIVRAFAAAIINLDCRRADQVQIRIERAHQPRLVEAHVGLNALQRVLGDEECNLHRAVVSPKTHRAPRRIERAALVGKTQRHRRLSETV